jgi:CRP-like cAMP-binding protein
MQSKSNKVRTLYPGDYFGEIAILYDSRRSTSVTSTNYTTLGMIAEKDVINLFEIYPFF